MVQGGTTVGGPPCHVFPMIDLDHEMDWDDISLGLFFTLIVCQTISSHNYWPKANWLHHSSLILLAGLWMWLPSVYRPISGATAPPSHEVLIQTVIEKLQSTISCKRTPFGKQQTLKVYDDSRSDVTISLASPRYQVKHFQGVKWTQWTPFLTTQMHWKKKPSGPSWSKPFGWQLSTALWLSRYLWLPQ